MLHACWMNRGSLVRTWLLVIAGCAVLLASTQTAAHGAAKALTADLSMSLSDGGTQWTAQSNQQSTTPSGTWTLTVRNTGTAASSGTTTIIFSAYSTGKFLPSTGKGWSCDDTNAVVHTCTNRTSVGPGGALEPLSFPWVAFGGYGYAYATATLSNPSSHNATHATASIYTPVVQQPAVDMSMSLSDRGAPWTAQSNQQSTTPSGTWTLRVRNTGTVASSGTTTIVFSAYSTGKFLPSTGKGWSCDDTNAVVHTCTNRTSVGAGGALEPLSFPWVAFGGYGYAYATATLSNPSSHNATHATASIYTPVVQQPAVDMSMSLSDGGAPWTAQSNQQSTTPSGTWTLRVRNTGTVASSGTTTIVFSAYSTGKFLPSTGKGWSCDDTNAVVRTCTSGWSVAPGGALPPLSLPWVSLPGYGYAYATATLSNQRNGTINHSTASIYTPVVEQPAVDLSMSLSDGGTPWTEQANPATTTTPSGTWTLDVRNTGTVASSGTTTVTFDAQSAGDYLQSSGQDWACADNGATLTCTNPDAVPAGGTLPPLSVPWATSSGGYAEASVTLANPSDGTINHASSSILTPVSDSSAADVVATISDGGQPFTAGQQAVYTITVSNAGTSPASGPTTVYYPVPFAGTVAAGTGWTCTPSDVASPDCSYSGGIAAGSALPPITLTASVPAQDAPASVQAATYVDNPNDTFQNDNGAHLVTDVTPLPIDVVATISDGGAPFTAG